MSTLPTIFTEAFIARLLPFKPEVSLPAMWGFGQPPVETLIAAGLGGLLAGLVLYVIGVRLRRLPKHVSNETQLARIEALRNAATGWLPWALILAPTPVGGILIMAAGFFAVKPWQVVAMVVAAEILWRASPLL